MRTILVATDYSESAETALKYVTFIASFTKAKIVLFNNYNFNIHALNGRISASAMDTLVKENRHRLEKYAEKLSEKYDTPLSTCTLTSMTEESLEQLAKKLDAGMIVMGMKENAEWPHVHSNTSATIISNVCLPVLIIPEGVEIKLPERVLYACDYHSVPKEDHLTELKEIATTFGSELQVFHVWKSPALATADTELKKAVLSQLEDSIGTLNHTYRDVDAKDIIEGLKKGIREFKADILVMSPHKYSFWNSLFHKSKTREMVFKSAIPLLSIPS